MRRGWAALAWTAGGLAVFALYFRTSLATVPSSDAANNMLQAWDMLHGHLVLHGWIIGDATYYTLELPVMAITEFFLGFHTIALHVAMALVYLLVTVCAVAIAVTDSRGASRVARAAVVVAVLAAPLPIPSDMWMMLGVPDHVGTSIFLLLCALLVDRAPARRFTAPLLCVILCAGQIGDATVRYVAVPAIALVCAYRMLAARKIVICDGANLLAAVVSVPLAFAIRTVMLHFGGYLMVAPGNRAKIAPLHRLPHNIVVTWNSLRGLFGTQTSPTGYSTDHWDIFGAVCMLAAAVGVLVALWRWRTARRADQVLLAAIAANIGAYVISTLPSHTNPYEVAAVVPCSAVLAARAIVPARVSDRLRGLAASGVAAVAAAAAVLPLAGAATTPTALAKVPTWTLLAPWLKAHGLRYGLGGYWDGSAVTLQSGNEVQVRTVKLTGTHITPFPWETNTLWFDPSRHYANFVIIDLTKVNLGPKAEGFFPKPVRTHRIANWEILIFNRNVLEQVHPPQIPPTSTF